MKLITKRQLMKKLPENWKASYFNDEKKTWVKYPDVEAMYNSLMKLDLETCSVESVEKIILKRGWLSLICDECKKEVNEVIQVGEEEENESRTANMCFCCFKKAAKMISCFQLYS